MVEGNDNHTNEPDSGSGTPKRRGGLFGARRTGRVRACGAIHEIVWAVGVRVGGRNQQQGCDEFQDGIHGRRTGV